MNHNPYDFKKGDVVILDEGFRNSSEVLILDFTPLKMFATICDPEDTDETWNIMTYRLTPKTENNEKITNH